MVNCEMILVYLSQFVLTSTRMDCIYLGQKVCARSHPWNWADAHKMASVVRETSCNYFSPILSLVTSVDGSLLGFTRAMTIGQYSSELEDFQQHDDAERLIFRKLVRELYFMSNLRENRYSLFPYL